MNANCIINFAKFNNNISNNSDGLLTVIGCDRIECKMNQKNAITDQGTPNELMSGRFSW